MATSVLIVDDSENLRMALRGFFETQHDLEVVGEASDGTEAIQKALKLMPEVVVLDVRMPNLNGLETALILKNRLPGTYVILFTLYDQSVGSRLSSMVGVDLVVSKSEGISALLGTLRRWVKTSRAVQGPPDTDRKAGAASRD